MLIILIFEINNLFLFKLIDMKFETYIKYREEFVNKFNEAKKNELGNVKLIELKTFNFRRFIFLFTNDNLSCTYTNTVGSLSTKKYIVKGGVPADKICIVDNKYFYDKYPERYNQVLEHYNKKYKNAIK